MTENDFYSDENNDSPVQGGEEYQGKNLLKMKKSEAAKRMMDEWDASRKYIRNHIEQWKVNQARSQGFTGVRLVKVQNENTFYAPLGAVPSATGMNKALRLKRRVKSRIFADPPSPHVDPSTDADDDRDKAEFATKALMVMGGPGGLRISKRAGKAFMLAGDYGSGFLRFWVDEQGGGHRPKVVEVRPGATSMEDAYVDPMTGLEWTGELVEMYVSGDELTDDIEQADREWLPMIQGDLLTGKHLRFIPHTSDDIEDADGVQIGAMVPLSQLKRISPEIAKMKDEDLEKIIDKRPSHAKDLLPVGQKDQTDFKVKDESLVFVLTRIHKACAEYPFGAYLIAVGEDRLIVQEEWYDKINDKPLDLPIAQFKHWEDEDNPYGRGLMEYLGPGNEVRAQVLGTMLEYLDKFRNRKTFVPITSNLQAKQLQAPTATVLPISPGGQPFYEEIPDFPKIVEKMLDFQTADLDDESCLQESAQGLSPGSVTSGKQVQEIVAQVAVSLSEFRENTEEGLIRCWRIMLQLARAYYGVPQRIAWSGEDGQHKEKLWVGGDLGDSTDVRMARGSFTMMAPEAKAQLAAELAQGGLLAVQQAISIVVGNVGPMIGIQEEPHRQRARRQITMWEQGPPENWAPQPPQQDPQTGQQMPVPDPTLTKIFQPLPVDDEPQIAALRAFELGRAVSSVRFLKFPPEWQQGLLGEYMRARQAAGIVTIAEQQQAQQQASQQQQQQTQTVEQTKLQIAQVTSDAEIKKSQIAAQGGLQKAQAEASQVPGVTGERTMPRMAI